MNTQGRLRAWFRLLIFYAAAVGVLAVSAAVLLVLGGEGAAGAALGDSALSGGFNPWLLAAHGLAFALPLLGITMLARRFLDRQRPLTSLGLGLKRAPVDVLAGFGAGLAFLGVTAAVVAACGGYKLSPAPLTAALLANLLPVVAFFAPFALIEELLLRGYPIKLLDENWNRAGAVLTTASIFAVLHLANPAATLTAVLNVALAGVILGLLYLKSGSLWMAFGFHWGWNVAEGAVLGAPVSGIPVKDTLLHATATGPTWLSGGAFGPESSLVLTVTASAAVAALVLLRRKPNLDRGIFPGGNPL